MNFFDNLAQDIIANTETANVDGVTAVAGLLLIQQRINERLVILTDPTFATADAATETEAVIS